MKKLILHLGLHKTGTTYLQRAVWPRWPGVEYIGKPTPRPFATPWDALAQLPGDTFLLSSEGFTGSLVRSYHRHQSWLELCRRNLEALADRVSGHYDLRLILTLRPREEWALSIYKHYLKYGGVDEMADFFGANPAAEPTCPVDELSIDARLHLIEYTFGLPAFRFCSHEMRTSPETLSQRLAAHCGLPEGPSFPSEERNRGVGETGKALCLRYNRMISNRDHRLRGYLSRTQSSGFSMVRKLSSAGLLPSDAPLELDEATRQLLRQTATNVNE